MINDECPWEHMPNSSQRRIYVQGSHNFFWIIDIRGNYGLCIQAKEIPIETDNKINLKGITIVKRNYSNEISELFLILNNNDDWQIFLALCEDLIKIANLFVTDFKMFTAVETRLKRWQQLLKIEHNSVFTIEKQMGLFSELLCLRDVVSEKLGFKQGIISWVGPEFDKQDFLMDEVAIEVKSYRTTKGDIVNISSQYQLQSEKDRLFLITYALTSSENGLSLEELVESIKKQLISESNWVLELFENKLIEYGFIPELFKEPLHKFIFDNEKVYFISDSFPRIISKNVKHQITSVKYTIDLSFCDEFKVKRDSIFEEGVIS
jgi:hypothetical protein